MTIETKKSSDEILANKLTRKLGFNFDQISIILISISLVLWSISIYFSKLYTGSYGLILGIHPFFFVAMALITISFFITIKYNIRNNKLLILHSISIVLFTVLIPLLLEGTPRFTYNLHTIRNVDYILQFGHSTTTINYQNWPGVFYFDILVVLISNIKPLNTLLYIPIIMAFVNLMLSYLIFSTFLNKRETWTALLLSLVLFFSSPIYLLPTTLGTIIATFAIMLFFRFRILSDRSSPMIGIIFIIFCSATVVSHFLSSVYLMVTLFFISFLLLISKKNSNKEYILLFVLIASWQIYMAGSFALDQIINSISTAFRIDATLSTITTAGFSGSQSHSEIVTFKLISILMLSVLALTGLLYEIKCKIRFKISNSSLLSWLKRNICLRNPDLKIKLLIAWLTSNLTVALITTYEGEILSRTFSVSNGILNMFAAKNINGKKLSFILLFIMLLAPPISIINAYGNEVSDYLAPAEIRGANFLFDHNVNRNVVLSLQQRVWNIKYSPNIENWAYNPKISFIANTPDNVRKVVDNFFILVGKRDMDTHFYLTGFKDYKNLRSIENSTMHAKVYDSQDFSLYYISGL